jgi:hypothetical protein
MGTGQEKSPEFLNELFQNPVKLELVVPYSS